MNDVQEFFKKIVGKSDEEWDYQVRMTRLATYNAEVGRGLVHTEEWIEFMRKEQEWWNNEGTHVHSPF